MNPQVLVISYHYIRETAGLPYPGIHPLAPDAFVKQLAQLQSHHPIISPAHFSSWLDGAPLGSPSVLLTFDDGLRDHLHAATILEDHGLRGAFFVCSRPALEGKALPVHKVHWLRSHTPPEDFLAQFSALLPAEWQDAYQRPSAEIQKAATETYQFDAPEHQVLKYLINFVLPYECVDQITGTMLTGHGMDEGQFCQMTYLSPAELQEMAQKDHLIGCHSHLHKPLSRFTPQELLNDLSTNKSFLQSIPGTEPSWLAYPYGTPGPSQMILTALRRLPSSAPPSLMNVAGTRGRPNPASSGASTATKLQPMSAQPGKTDRKPARLQFGPTHFPRLIPISSR